MKILIKRLRGEKEINLHAPKKDGDVGWDIATSEDTVVPILPATSVIVPAAVAIKIPKGYFCQIVGRSSAARKGLDVHTATIDEGYTGELFACVTNLTNEPIKVLRGERLAQAVFHKKSPKFKMEEVDMLPETERGESGFGSTGK